MIHKMATVMASMTLKATTMEALPVAEAVLEAQEALGMTPPFVHDVYYKTWRDGGDGCVWEAEDSRPSEYEERA